MTPAEIEAMDRAALVAAWTAIFATRVPKGLSKPLMRRFLAAETHARRLGGLSRSAKAILLREPAAGERKRCPGLKPGSRLIREWNGLSHVVEVTGEGFRWNGSSYRSLSAIARAITGAHWSGPRFFALKATAKR